MTAGGQFFGTSLENSIVDIEDLENRQKPKKLPSSLLRSEEDVRVKIINPYLKTLGFDLDKDSFHEETIAFTIGTRQYTLDLRGRSDTIIRVHNKNLVVVEAKRYEHSLTRKDWEELRSFVYALINKDETIPRYAVLTNGHKCVIRDLHLNKWLRKIPEKKDILATFDTKILITEIERDVARKKVFTQASEEKLINIVSKTEEYLREEGYDGEKAFVEFAKILLTKINEDKRFAEGKISRFEKDVILDLEEKTNKEISEIINELFNDAKNEFSSIFNPNDRILLESRNVILKIVKIYEPYILYRLDFDLFGIVYEKFFADIFKGKTGKFFTPREIVEFMVEFADLEIGDRICDPACGSGGFLTRAYKNLRAQVSDLVAGGEDLESHDLIRFIEDQCIIGNDIDVHLVTLTKLNMVIHGDGWNNIYRSDVFQIDNSPLTDWHGSIDVILTNPPFSLPISGDKLKDYRFGRGKEEAISDLLFVERCYRLLRLGGRLLIVLPSGWTNNPDDQYFRDYLYENWIEIATISLPEGVFKSFGGSGAKTVIFYLKKPLNQNDKQGDVLKINISHVDYDHRSKHYKKIPWDDLNKVLQLDEFVKFKQKLYLEREKDRRYRELRKRLIKYAK